MFELKDIISLNNLTPKTICFTGSRPNKLTGYDKAGYNDFVEQLDHIISQIIDICKTENFITGGAQGFDQLAFWTIERIRKRMPHINNNLHIAFHDVDRKWKDTGLFSRTQFKQMRLAATSEIIIKEHLDAETAQYGEIAAALYERNHAMVNSSDLIIALYPSTDWQIQHKSGTAECMRYAKKCKKPILQLMYTTDNNILKITQILLIMNS